MLIHVKYFSIIRETIGKAEEDWEIPEQFTAVDLWKQINQKYSLAKHESYLRFAVNLDYVQNHHQLQHNDEVALITPVAGG